MSANGGRLHQRITLVGPWPPYRGGIAHFTAELGRALGRRGHHVDGVSFARQYPMLLFPGRSQMEPDGSPSDVPSSPRLIDSLNPASWWRASNYLRDLALDAVVFQHWTPFLAPSYGTIARRLVRADGSVPRRVVLVHNALPHERRPGDEALSRYFLRACDAAIALSGSVASDLRRLAPELSVLERAHPVYEQFGPAADRSEARQRLGLPQRAPVLLFFGFVRHYKGLDVLLDALPGILASHPDAVLVVAGEFYDDESRYRGRVRRLGISRAVRFEDRYVPSSDVPLYFGAADLVVQPYRSATQSGVAQTAFGLGLPVVTTDVGGLGETVRHDETGLIVPPEDPPSLARAINRFLGDVDLQRRLREGARRQRQRPGWEPLCEAVETLIDAEGATERTS